MSSVVSSSIGTPQSNTGAANSGNLPTSKRFQLQKLKEAITELTINSEGLLEPDGPETLSEIFYQPSVVLHLRNPNPDPQVIKYKIGKITSQLADSKLEDVLKQSWNKWSLVAFDIEDVVSLCINSVEVKNALNSRIAALRTQLMWQAVVSLLEFQTSEELELPRLRQVWNLYSRMRVGSETEVLLEDWLMNLTNYGRLLKHCKFENAAAQLEEPDLTSDIEQLKTYLESVASGLLRYADTTSEVRDLLLSGIGLGATESKISRLVRKDGDFNFQIYQQLIGVRNEMKRATFTKSVVQNALKLESLKELSKNVELDIVLGASMSFLNSWLVTTQEVTVSDVRFWHYLSLKLELMLKSRSYRELWHFKAEKDEKLQLSEFLSSTVDVVAPEATDSMVTILACYLMIEKLKLRPLSYRCVTCYHQVLQRQIFLKVRARISDLMRTNPAKFQSVTPELLNWILNHNEKGAIEDVEVAVKSSFYAKLVQEVSLRYINTSPGLKTLAKLVQGSEADPEVRNPMIVSIVSYLRGVLSEEERKDEIGTFNSWMSDGTLRIHIDSEYLEVVFNFLASELKRQESVRESQEIEDLKVAVRRSLGV